MNLSTSSRNLKPETRFPAVAPVSGREGGLGDPMAAGGIEDGLALNDSLQDSLSGGDFAANDVGFSEATPSAPAQPVQASGQEDALTGDEERDGDDAHGAKAGAQAGSEGGAGAGGRGAPGAAAGGGAGAAGTPGKGEDAQETKAHSAADDKAAASNAGGSAPGASSGGSAPTSPEADPAFQAVKSSIEAKAQQQQDHPEGSAAAADAQGAAVGPPNEVSSKAGAAQVETMEAQEPGVFDKDAFKAAIKQKIAELTPQNLDAMDKFKENGGASQVKTDVVGKVGEGKDTAAQSIEQASTAEPDESGIEAKEVTPLTPPAEGEAPTVNAEGAAPKPVPEAELSLDAGPTELDTMMSDAEITDEQLLNSNEPDFVGAVDAKAAAEDDSATQPSQCAADQAAIVATAQASAQDQSAQGMGLMHQQRASALGQTSGVQANAQSKDESARAEVATQIETLFNDTQTAVEERLKKLDEDVDRTFTDGAATAQKAFEDSVSKQYWAWWIKRYGGPAGALLWVGDQFLGLPEEVSRFYDLARDEYITAMDGVIDDVATVVETGLTETKGIISAGRQKIADYVNGLPETLRGVGEEAASDLESRFAELEQSVTDKQSQLVDSLAQRYTENLSAIDARIAQMKEANKGWVDAAKEKLGGVIQTIRDLKNMLTGVLSRAGDAIGLIIKDPIGFLGNLVTGVGAGLHAFMGNIGTHLKTGLMEWLFGAISSAGLTMPESFDLQGILDLALQVLGLTKDAFRARAVQLLGEPVVSAIETGVEVFRVVMTEGIGGLWTWIKDKVGDLQEMVLGTIRDWISSKVITAGITWILSMLNPASAFIKACKAVYDIIMFFVDRGSQIMSLVNAVIDSVMAIAQGDTGGVAKAVEGALAKGIPVAIGFLSSLLGLTGIDEFIQGAIEKVREPVSKAVDWVIQKAKDLGATILAKLGFGKGEDKGKDAADGLPEGKVGAEVSISAPDESHTLWTELHGGTVEFMIASSPQPAGRMLKNIGGRISKLQSKIPSDDSKSKKNVAALSVAHGQLDASLGASRQSTQAVVSSAKNSAKSPKFDKSNFSTKVNATSGLGGHGSSFTRLFIQLHDLEAVVFSDFSVNVSDLLKYSHMEGERILKQQDAFAKRHIHKFNGGDVAKFRDSLGPAQLAALFRMLDRVDHQSPQGKSQGYGIESRDGKAHVSQHYTVAPTSNIVVSVGKEKKYSDKGLQKRLSDYHEGEGGDRGVKVDALIGAESARNPASLFYFAAQGDILRSQDMKGTKRTVLGNPMAMAGAQQASHAAHNARTRPNEQNESTKEDPKGKVSTKEDPKGKVSQFLKKEESLIKTWLKQTGQQMHFSSKKEVDSQTKLLKKQITARMESVANGTR